MALQKRKKAAKTKSLPEQVETINLENSVVDGLDSDVLAHVNHFLTTPFPQLEKFSLNTREEALEALVIIERTQRSLEERYRTVQMLKSICEAAKKEEI